MKLGRVVGIDDGYFERSRDRKAPLVITIMKSSVIEGFIFSWLDVDGTNATSIILDALAPIKEQISAVFLYGTIFAGTNVVSMNELYNNLKKPIIAIADEKPDNRLIERAFRVFGSEISWKIYTENPSMMELKTKRGILYVSSVGASRKEVLRIVEHYQLSSKIPEPIRISHLVGKAVGRWI